MALLASTNTITNQSVLVNATVIGSTINNQIVNIISYYYYTKWNTGKLFNTTGVFCSILILLMVTNTPLSTYNFTINAIREYELYWI